MDLPLLESVPNVSVGRDVAVVDMLVDAAREGARAAGAADGTGAEVVDVHRDSDHDRSVLTILGRGEALAGALEALARVAVEALDLHAGHGVHPRVGVLDVVPIIAMEEGDAAFAAAQSMAARVGTYIGTTLEVPVVRYGLDAGRERIEGAGYTGEVRRGGPATVAERVMYGDLARIAGPNAPHPTAGMTICGVREVLVAFNVDLDADGLDAARAIAGRIRATADSDDMLLGVRALGLRLASRGVAQVSTNIEIHASVGPARVLSAITRIATELGVGVSAAELVGLAPDTALAPLRYACTGGGIPLLASSQPSLDEARRSFDAP
ncbi:MAG: Formimidoyltetrahydrofolate cyclodeaminase [Thermoleophilia bacterium]|nr:Formimidoyltetrahydrofolate cyclodeaminase [Thermoleophilia bacterium]